MSTDVTSGMTAAEFENYINHQFPDTANRAKTQTAAEQDATRREWQHAFRDATSLRNGIRVERPHPFCRELNESSFEREQFFEAGRFLARIEHGMQWAIGDWYNAIPEGYGDKKAACEKAGLDYKHAVNCGWVAARYKQRSLRHDHLSFDHHRMVAIEELDDEQRASLLRRAEWGELKKDGARRPWTIAELVQERDTLLGREKVPLPDFDAKVNQTVDSLPKNVGEKAGRVDCHGLPG